MATLTATRAADSFPASLYAGAGVLQAAYGKIDLAANPSVNDVLKFCKVPAGAVIIDGFMRAEDIDSNASETLDIDIGTSADTDAFGNFGVLVGDAVTGYLPEGGTRLPLHGTLKDGPVAVTSETTIQGIVNAVAATFAAGTITVVVYYVMA
jgi:hypothetical protein